MSIYKIRTEFGKHLKILLGIVALIFVVGAAFQFGPMQPGRDTGNKGNEGVVARINGEDVPKAEFNALVAQTEQFMSKMGSNSPLDYADMKGYLIQQMVQKKLLVQQARKLGIDLSDRKVNDELDKKLVEVMNASRARALGLSEAQAKKVKTDPREDKKYIEQLAMVNRTVKDEEENARAMISKDDVLYEVATKELTNYFKKQVKRPTDADIKNSYNVYNVRQIMIAKDKFPAEQALTQANKIADEARTGDFAKLAKEYSMMPNSDVQPLTFESMRGYPANVKEAVEKLSPGKVSRATETDMGYFIVKMESKENAMPASLDKKAKDERRKAIEQERMMAIQMEFSKKVDPSKANVQILDNELNAYWLLGKANQAFANKKEYDKLQKMAIESLKKAIKENNANSVAMAKLAQLYQQTGNTKKAKEYLLQILEGDKVVEDASLRMMLGDLYAGDKAKEDALAQYKIASEVAQSDTKIHTQLIDKYKQLGSAELASYEENKVKELNANAAELQKQQAAAKSALPAGKK